MYLTYSFARPSFASPTLRIRVLTARSYFGMCGLCRWVIAAIARSPASHLRETSHHVSCTWCIYCWLFAHGASGMHAAKGSQHLVYQTPIACGTHGGCESGEELNCGVFSDPFKTIEFYQSKLIVQMTLERPFFTVRRLGRTLEIMKTR